MTQLEFALTRAPQFLLRLTMHCDAAASQSMGKLLVFGKIKIKSDMIQIEKSLSILFV